MPSGTMPCARRITPISGSPFRMKSQWSTNNSGIFDAVMPTNPTLTPFARMRSAQAVSFL